MTLEWLLFCLSLGWVLFWLGKTRAGKSSRRLIISILIAAAGSSVAWQVHTHQRLQSVEQLQKSVPREDRPDGYVSSDKCQSCHPDQYASWHQSYHRTMTQTASSQTVVGDFNNVRLELDGKSYLLQRRGDEFWVEMDDPGWNAPAKPVDHSGPAKRLLKRVGLLTGSHHMQVYWLQGDAGNKQNIFPFAWLITDQRWAPFHATFLRDPAQPPVDQSWNLNCINCHSTGGQPRPNSQARVLDTRAGELGIACEACHGTAQQHVQLFNNPIKRYLAHKSPTNHAELAIVNPEHLPAKRSSQVCGTCHGIKWISDRNDWLQFGFRFQPGQDLHPATPIVRPAQLATQPWLKGPLQRNPTFVEERYWPDGMVRVSGREYNGLVESPCHERGELSCLSCHSMHKSQQPDDQLALDMHSNRACLQCHSSINPEQHSRHSTHSSGNLCYNCHMPHTTYGLLKAIRSHQIDSPSVQASLQTGRPNACNLCHLDQSLAWTAKHLNQWFSQKIPPLTEEQEKTSAALMWMLKGDAGQRALLAWSAGWVDAHQTSGKHWLVPFLGQLLDDPYSAVRYIASRSLRQISTNYQSLHFDFVGPAAQRQAARTQILELWKKSTPPDRKGDNVLIDSSGTLQQEKIDALLRQRDDRSMDLQE